jgi:hypothetical protein
MVRVASLAFILRAGVKCTPATNTSKFSSYRTIQATIDTILYERLKIAERDLFRMLQRLVFRSAGYLNREQVYPVALVLWQLLRILCIGASHLSNLVQRFRIKGTLPLLLPIFLPPFQSANTSEPSLRTSRLPIPRPQARPLHTPRTLPLLQPAPPRLQRQTTPRPARWRSGVDKAGDQDAQGGGKL